MKKHKKPFDCNYTRPINDPILKQAGIHLYKAKYITKFSTGVQTEEPYVVMEELEFDIGRGGETAELNPFIDSLAGRRQLDVLVDYFINNEPELWERAATVSGKHERERIIHRVIWCLESKIDK